MRLVTYPDIESFLGEAQATMEVREAENNLPMGLALQLRGHAPAAADPPFR